ncbi:C-type lectin domain family 14 member A [Alosa alosa]|uniref:C-type lectin domain family 14 member A n=1 Tax=Alosa alosa TaxID=278164 RepID=UPI0020154924|nr:C-type lectin domain family 14 member A [Alosa alosa]
MESWILFLSFLQVVSCLDTFHYVIHGDEANFEAATKNCQHEGNLTSLSTWKEVQAVQQALSRHLQSSGEYTYWIGLWRQKQECVEHKAKLKGFKWMDGGKEAEEIKWKEEPESTCTHDRCVYISIKYDGTSVVDWGLIGSSCKKTHPFICKVKGEKQTPAPKDCTIPTIGGTHDHIHKVGNPSKLDIICDNTKTYNLTCNTKTLEWITKEGSTVNLSSVCVPCPKGFEKSYTGQCVDIDECKNQPCKDNSKCVNLKGSFQCKDSTPQPPSGILPTDPHTHPTQPNTQGPFNTQEPDGTANPGSIVLIDVTESSPDYSHIYIPVIIAVLALLLLLVVILTIVACCRRKKRKRSKNLSGQKASKESMALRDSMEKIP